MDRPQRNHCDECRFWSKGYRLQGMKVPSFCAKHFHGQAGDDPACAEFAFASCPICSGDCSAANPPVINCPMGQTS